MPESRTTDIRDRASLDAWLLSRPELARPIDALILVHRCTLRAVPLLQSVQLIPGDERSQIFLAAFRLAIEARTNLAKISSTPKLSEASPNDSLQDRTRVSSSHSLSYTYSILECMNAVATFASATESNRSLSKISATVAEIQSAVFNATYSQGPAESIWASVSADASSLESDANIETMFRGPIWNVQPKWWQDELTSMLMLFASDKMIIDQWSVWEDWYNPISIGKEAFNLPRDLGRKIEQRIALGDGRAEFWNREPGKINAEIGGWIAQAREQVPFRPVASPTLNIKSSQRPTAGGAFSTTSVNSAFATGYAGNFTVLTSIVPESVLKQPNLAVSTFRQAPNGQIVLDADPFNPTDNTTNDDLQDLYAEARLSVLELFALGSNKLGICLEPCTALLNYFPEMLATASINRIWSKTNRLRDILYQHKREIEDNSSTRDVSHVLEPDTAVRVASCVKQLNVLIAFDTRGRELDRLSRGPETRKRDNAQIAAASPIINNIFNIADGATVSVVQGDHNAVNQAGNNIHGDQAIERISAQELNLVMAILLASRRIVAATNSISPEAVVQILSSTSGQFGPQIVKFVAQHRDSFESVVRYIDDGHVVANFIKLVFDIGKFLV